MARPSKFTPERQRLILECLKAGMTRTAAAAKAGIELDTLAAWCRRYSEFSGDCTRAEGEAEARFTSVIAQAAAPHEVIETTTTQGPDGTITKTVVRREFDWRAALEWLKRRRYATWGDRKQIDVRDLSDDQIIRLLEGSAEEGSTEERAAGSLSPLEP